MKGLKIFYYHLISETEKDYYPHQSTITTKVFEEQIKYYSNRYEIITINEAYKRFQSGSKLDKQLVITTDDGFSENYTNVCPILEKYKAKGSFFLIENSIDNKMMMWRHILFILRAKVDNTTLYEEVKSLSKEFEIIAPEKDVDMLKWSYRQFPNKSKDNICKSLWNRIMPMSVEEYLANNSTYLTSEQIKEMLQNGHTIGSHSKTHPNTELLNVEELDFEVNKSLKRLEEKFETKVISFAFPFGANERASKIISKEFPDVKVQLGIMKKLNSNTNSPIKWERLNMETSSFK
ncbi:MAG: polysaccharide deacetylase family protein, partial [Ignavibacteriae bacterium]|nr:polysaccharide deacetylase family protein [Ignavibacteriota bacterium]